MPPPHLQYPDENGVVAKFRSFRDILESIDEQENDMRNFNQLQALKEENEEDAYDPGQSAQLQHQNN